MRVKIRVGRDDGVGKGAPGEEVEWRHAQIANDPPPFTRIDQRRRIEFTNVFSPRRYHRLGRVDHIRIIDEGPISVAVLVSQLTWAKPRTLNGDMLSANGLGLCASMGSDIGITRRIDYGMATHKSHTPRRGDQHATHGASNDQGTAADTAIPYLGPGLLTGLLIIALFPFDVPCRLVFRRLGDRTHRTRTMIDLGGEADAIAKAKAAAIAAARDESTDNPARLIAAEAEIEAAFARVTPGKFDYDAAVPGLRIINDGELEIILSKPIQQFRWKLAQFQLGIVPREAVEKYGEQFGRRPIGTGPYAVRDGDWEPGRFINFTRNPTYRNETYPSEIGPDATEAANDRALGLDKPAGQRLPILDRVECPFYVPDPAMWLDFEAGKLGFVQIPAEYFDKAINRRTQKLRPEFADKRMTLFPTPLLDFIFRGFNMQDPIVGGYDEKRKKLRQAISLAFDLDEMNESFYNSTNIVYDGPIPPGLDGHPPGGATDGNYRGPDVARAKKLLAEAGYPGGKGLPEIVYYSSRGGNQTEQTQAEVQFCKTIGIKLAPRLVDFSELIEAINKKIAPMFGYAWGSDYPDGENNLSLFYSKNESPGPNAFNYNRPEFDALYERCRRMPPGPERTTVYLEMRDMLIEDTPYIGSLARTRYYLINPWLKNFKPSEDFQNWYKYLDVSGER